MYKINWENGIDNNYDGHCDLCGRFVDKFGHHRAIRIFDFKTEEIDFGYIDLDNKISSMSTNEFIKDYIKGDPYNPYENMTYKYWPYILTYSLNNDDPLSSKGLNNFLRNDTIPKSVNSLYLINRPLEINCAIGQFIVKNTFISYRGLSFDKECEFTQMLDEAFKDLKNNKLYKYTENGFTSTTRDIDYARFLSNRSNAKIHVLFSYVNLPGAKAMPLSKEFGTTENEMEQEILLKCLHTFYICSLQRYKIGKEIYYRGILINTEEENYADSY